MKWQVRGTRKDNGRPAVASIEAATQEEARRKAATKLVVRSVQPVEELAPVAAAPAGDWSQEAAAGETESGDIVPGFDAPASPVTPAYETPAALAAPPHGHHHVLPEYRDIVDSTRWLKPLALIVGIVGLLFIGLGGLILISAVFSGVGNSGRSSSPFGPPSAGPLVLIALIPSLALMAYGLICIIVAAAIRLACGIGLAVRDTARNSFH